MRLHKIEKIIYIISVVSLIIFLTSIPSLLIFKDRFFMSELALRLFFVYGELCPFVILYIVFRRKKRGYKKPLSIEAMRNGKEELPSKIYKFCSLSTGSDKSLDEAKLYSLENNKIWMSDLLSLNDPFEGEWGLIDKNIENDSQPMLSLLREKMMHERDMYIQTSFSYEFSNILMWGHYANGCRGYCIEYTVESQECLFPVQYLDKRLLLSSITNDKIVAENLFQMQKSFSKCDPDESILYMLYLQSIKSNIWQYEKEVRLVDIGQAEPDKKCGNADCNLYGLKASKIIVGYLCTYKNELGEIAKKLNIPITTMSIPMHSDKYFLEEQNFTL